MPTNANTLHQDGDNTNLLAYLQTHGRREHFDVLGADVEAVYDCEGHGYHVDIQQAKLVAITQGATWGVNKIEAAHVRRLIAEVTAYIQSHNLGNFEDIWEEFKVYGVAYEVNIYSAWLVGDDGEGLNAVAYALKPDIVPGNFVYDPAISAKLLTNFIPE